MDPIGDALGGIIGGIAGLTGAIAETAVGAVMSWLGLAVQGMAVIAGGVIDVLPDVGEVLPTVPSGWLSAYAMMNTFLPLSEALALTGVLVGIYAALGAWKLAVTIYHLIPKPLMGT